MHISFKEKYDVEIDNDIILFDISSITIYEDEKRIECNTQCGFTEASIYYKNKRISYNEREDGHLNGNTVNIIINGELTNNPKRLQQ